jgi:hypothetical protein
MSLSSRPHQYMRIIRDYCDMTASTVICARNHQLLLADPHEWLEGIATSYPMVAEMIAWRRCTVHSLRWLSPFGMPAPRPFKHATMAWASARSLSGR